MPLPLCSNRLNLLWPMRTQIAGCHMTAEERESLEDLCNRITEENDPVTFDELVLALNELLEKTQRISTCLH